MTLNQETLIDITKRLYQYDTTRPRMDELKFIQRIMDDYNVDRKEAIKMIQSARRLSVLDKK